MTGKPREKFHTIHLQCLKCGRYHYNTRNQITVLVITRLYPNDPLEDHVERRIAARRRVPYGLNSIPALRESYRLFSAPLSLNNNDQLEDNNMEGLEPETPSTTSGVPSSLPPLETMSVETPDWV